MRPGSKWAVVVKAGDAVIGVVGPFHSKAKAEAWAAANPDLQVDNEFEIHEMLKPEWR